MYILLCKRDVRNISGINYTKCTVENIEYL